MTPASYFPYKNNEMFVENIAISDIAQKVQTPFYCYSSAAIETSFYDYQQAFSEQDTLICYAVKANSNQAVLATLAKLGSGADVVSMGEIRRAIAAGIPAKKNSLFWCCKNSGRNSIRTIVRHISIQC
jgi:diaminopimelate decarboxylase